MCVHWPQQFYKEENKLRRQYEQKLKRMPKSAYVLIEAEFWLGWNEINLRALTELRSQAKSPAWQQHYDAEIARAARPADRRGACRSTV